MTVFRFLYDARGTKLDAPAPPPAKRVAAAAPQPHPTPRDPAVMVHELEGWLDAHREFGLDMGLLEEREILITPPHWTFVARAAASLLGNELAEPGTEEDRRQAVQKYVDMLVSREKELDYALALASYASIASVATDDAERIQDALRALPKGAKMDLQFREDGPKLRPLTRGLLAQGKVKEWADEVYARHDEIVRSAYIPVWRDVAAASWKTWQKRLSEYHKSRRSFPVSHEDLLLRTRSAGPAALFWNDLPRMPLRLWTDALLIASRENVPAWVKSAIERELLAGRKTLLMIAGDSVASPTAQWLPSKKNGNLWIAREKWVEFFEALPPDIYGHAVTRIVSVEVGGDPEVVTGLINTPPPVILGRYPVPAPFFAFLGKDKLPPQLTPAAPYVDNARDVDDAISKIEMLTGGHP